MAAILLPGKPPVEILVRSSARARRLSLRVSSLDGRVTLTIPRGVSRRTAETFAAEKNDWIRKHLSRQPQRVVVAPGQSVPIDGVEHQIEAAPIKARAVVEGDRLLVPEGRPTGPIVRAFLKEHARARLRAAADQAAEALGRNIERVDLRDPRSRWGSCSSAGRLMFSWRLAMAPADVADYVAIHEAAHLVHMDHSPRFWSVVERLCPDWKRHRNWLRSDGGGLHGYVFDTPD